MLRLRRALLLRAAAKDMKTGVRGQHARVRQLVAVRGQPAIGTLCSVLVSN